jgi:hypothetical protein
MKPYRSAAGKLFQESRGLDEFLSNNPRLERRGEAGRFFETPSAPPKSSLWLTASLIHHAHRLGLPFGKLRAGWDEPPGDRRYVAELGGESGRILAPPTQVPNGPRRRIAVSTARIV